MKDIDSGFKLIKKEVIDNVLKEVKYLKFCVMSEFILNAYLMGYRIKEVPVHHFPRKFGDSSIFTLKKLPMIIIGLINSLFIIKKNYKTGKNK